jgi:hypothetical protein
MLRVINMRNWLLPKFMANYTAATDWFVCKSAVSACAHRFQVLEDEGHRTLYGGCVLARNVARHSEGSPCPRNDGTVTDDQGTTAPTDCIPKQRAMKRWRI